jgi:transglutaminase-like putative cysteine protease
MKRTIPIAIRADGRYRIVEESRIVDLLVLSGWAREAHSAERAPAVQAAAAALDRWTGAGLPFARSNDGGRRFDPAEVVNFLKFIGLRDGDPVWEECFIATARGIILEFHALEGISGAPPSPASLPGERFAVTLQREFDLGSAQPAARTLLRLPLPLEDNALRNLQIRTISPRDVDVEFTIKPGCLDARLSAVPRRAITLGVHVSFTAYPTIPSAPARPLAASEIELYTRPSEALIKVSPRIRALAAELAGAERDSWKVVRRFWNFMLDELTIGVLHYDELDPSKPTDWVLETGWFDCHLGSALLIALCRARGIPARLLSGHMLYSANPGQHYWSEIWTDACGWTPIDTISSDLSVRGRDAPWRDYFLGCLDYRMKTQCLPRLFNQNPGMSFPPAWHMLTRAEGEGIEIGFFANDSGALVYRDRVSVQRGDGATTRE